MGVANSIEIEDHFKRLKEWPWSRTSKVLREYTDNEYDFGIDATAVMNLTSLTISEAKVLVDSLARNNSGIINGLTLLSVIILLCEGKQRLESDRIEEIFKLVDFDGTGQITKAELTIMLLCVSSAMGAILGRQDERPMDGAVSDIAASVYKELKKKQNANITKKEFASWCVNAFKDYGATVDKLFDFFVQRPEPQEEIVKAGVLPDYSMDPVSEENK